MHLSIVIPALDEAARLPASLEAISAFLADQPELCPAEVVVVDDGSTDGTASAAEAVRRPSSVELAIVRHEVNRGKGAAVRSGFLAARGDQVLLSDADLSTPVSEIHRLRSAVAAGRVAIGSRAVDRRLILTRQPWYRDVMGRCFNLIQQTLALYGIVDTQCGFKLFPGDLARALAGAQRLDGFAYDVELLVIARHWGVEIDEIGVVWRHMEASRVAPLRHSSQMLRDLFRLWWWRISGQLPEPPAGLRGGAS